MDRVDNENIVAHSAHNPVGALALADQPQGNSYAYTYYLKENREIKPVIEKKKMRQSLKKT